MSSDWHRLAERQWYRKRDVFEAQWSDDPDRLSTCVVAGAPFGGPVATVRDERKFVQLRGPVRPELQMWTSAGRLIASAPWVHTGLLKMGWSSQEVLVCVFESGVVRTFSVMCEKLGEFTVHGSIEREGGVKDAALWGGGVALLSRQRFLYINASVTRSADACYRCIGLSAKSRDDTPFPLCLCAVPGASPADVRIIVGTAEGPVLLLDRHECRDLNLDGGPFMLFSMSSSGKLLAGLSTKGVFKVLSVSQNFRDLETAYANINNQKNVEQMVWCGDDCVAFYLVPDIAQHVIIVGGPGNDWMPHQYDAPLHLVSEIDGLRILGTHKVEFLQAVPQATEEIYTIGNCEAPAMLCYAFERFDQGDMCAQVCAQQSLHTIKDELEEAVRTCISAACHEHDDKVEALLNAAVFGRHFMSATINPDEFIETCKHLRICLQLRKEPLDTPLTVPQLKLLGIEGLVLRLAQRRHHFLASRICEWVGHPRDQVLFHWACEKIRHKKGQAKTDEELSEAIMEKFSGCPGAGYAEVARKAAEMHRPHLATLLLDQEPRGYAQVQVHLQISREVPDPADRLDMLRRAAEKAVQSCDPDLIYGVISSACGGDPSSRDAPNGDIIALLKSKPQELQMVGDVFAASMQRNQHGSQHLRNFYQQLNRTRRAANSTVMQVFRHRDADDRMKWIRFAKDSFGQGDPAALEAEKASMQFCAQSCSDEAELLKAQVGLEEESVTKRWSNGPHRFAGLPAVDTIIKLLQLGEIPQADNLRATLRISDKRYWRIKIRALSEVSNLSALEDLWKTRTSPIGYELFVEAFLKHDRHDLAGDRELLSKVKNPDALASFYSRMGREEEAQAARAQGEARAGPGRFFQNLGLRLGQG